LNDPSARHVQARLDASFAALRAAVLRRRAGDPGPHDAYRGLYLPDGRLRALLEPASAPQQDAEAAALARAAEAAADESAAGGADLRLRRLSGAFGLEPLDVELLLAALLPDADARAEPLIAYLHDDVTRRRATAGLALALAGHGPLDQQARARLQPGAPLVDGRLVLVEDGERPLLTRSLRVPDRVTAHLLGGDDPDPLLVPLLAEPLPSLAGDPVALAQAMHDGAGLCYLREKPGASGRSLAAAALHELGAATVALDLTRVRDEPLAELAAVAVREARLTGAGLVVGPIEVVAERGVGAVRAFAEQSWPTLLYGHRSWDPAWSREVPLVVDVPAPVQAARSELWSTLLPDLPPDAIEATAAYALSPEQVARASRAADLHARHAGQPLGVEALRAGARSQNAAGLERLARRIEPAASWDDIVLPGQPLGMLHELCARARLREKVLDGFGLRQSSRGIGVSALFAGPSGTGKTLAAEVIAYELGFDLYTVDLASVIDKYVGETEKNLDRIFGEAEQVNGVLFFDEADALFGKRSEVKDAHDRYANVEVAYLLQRMEAFDGLAILATNLRSNLDDAFARRLDALIDFPMPDKAQRLQLWEYSLRPGVPRDEGLDLAECADRFEIAGGNIRNICVAAAFFAAEEDRPVCLADLIRATDREFKKLGRMSVERDFGPHFHLIAGGKQ
jgi:hypothetical protein